MKNIHILLTDKLSKLYVRNDVTPPFYSNFQGNSVNMYITSDEKMYKGDAIFWLSQNKVIICEDNSMSDRQDIAKKIILTTDQDLIAYGSVQAIPDEFLTWFFKNQSCEYVEIDTRLSVKVNGIQGLMEDEYYQKFPEELPNCVFFNHYKIIIPKEKEEFDIKLNEKDFCHYSGLPSPAAYEEPKQETIEEAAKKYLKNCKEAIHDNIMFLQGSNFGAKWQLKESQADTRYLIDLLKQTTEFEVLQSFRDKVDVIGDKQDISYNEGEVIKLLISCKDRFGGSDLDDYTHDDKVKEWFSQIKKK